MSPLALFVWTAEDVICAVVVVLFIIWVCWPSPKCPQCGKRDSVKTKIPGVLKCINCQHRWDTWRYQTRDNL